MDLPSRAFYEGVNPKTIWNNCHECTHRHFLTLHVGKTGREKQGENRAKSAIQTTLHFCHYHNILIPGCE